MDCVCSKCGEKVPYSVKYHFTGDDGKIYCKKCSVGIKPCSDRIKRILIELENKC